MCPQELEKGENEDDFNDIEYSIIDGIDMGCQTNDAKGHIKPEYFHEEKIHNMKVHGIEVKDHAFIVLKTNRDTISYLLKNIKKANILSRSLKKIGKKVDENMSSALVEIKF